MPQPGTVCAAAIERADAARWQECINMAVERRRASPCPAPRLILFVTAAIVLGVARLAAAQDSFNAARELYTAAAYEDALALLDRLRASAHRADDSRYIEQYRAFCLLALGRAPEAEHAIEAVVTAAPSYRPAESDASPRVRLAFRDVRRRMLPAIIQQKYADAKAAFDRKEGAVARNGFRQVLELLNDPDIAAASNSPPLAQIKTLAAGFRDLSVSGARLAAQQVPQAHPAPVQVPTPPPHPVPRIYGIGDADVVPPVPVRESLAALADVFALRPGVLEIIIDESGAVEVATMRASVNPAYDRLVLATARSWRYRPATLAGEPVKFRKLFQLDVRTTR
jgi:tetratricopeptide (TPR) repeat protein